jgi:hypothetical protein
MNKYRSAVAPKVPTLSDPRYCFFRNLRQLLVLAHTFRTVAKTL